MQVKTLKAVDLEETLTRQDELLMAYTLTSYDQKGQAVAMAQGSWGIVEAKKGQVFPETAFPKIQLQMPLNGKIVASLVLIEVDNYAKAQQTLTKLRTYNDYLKFPVGLAELADVALTPLKYISISLSALGIGFQLADRLDDDDVLGEHQTVLTYVDAQQTPLRPVPVVFENSSFASSYRYELRYDLQSQSIQVKGKSRR